MTNAERDREAAKRYSDALMVQGQDYKAVMLIQGVYLAGCAHVRAEIPAIEARVRAEERARVVERLRERSDRCVPMNGHAWANWLESEFEKEKRG